MDGIGLKVNGAQPPAGAFEIDAMTGFILMYWLLVMTLLHPPASVMAKLTS